MLLYSGSGSVGSRCSWHKTAYHLRLTEVETLASESTYCSEHSLKLIITRVFTKHVTSLLCLLASGLHMSSSSSTIVFKKHVDGHMTNDKG